MTFVERLTVDQNTTSDILYDEHLVRYKLVSHLVKDKVVLDIACGTGYGTEILAQAGAAKVLGMDIDEQTISENKQRYQVANLDFQAGSAEQLNLADQSFDLITSFETIEHLPNIEAYLSELKRVIKTDGLVIISTPNKEVSHEKNPWHLKEFTKTEFVDLLKKYFPEIELLEQKNAIASFIKVSNKEEGRIIFNDSSDQTLYFIAVCSLRKITEEMVSVASCNVGAYERWKNNPGWKFLGFIYRGLKKIKIIS